MKTNTFQIRYNHRGWQTADSYASALHLVRSEMLPSKETPAEIAAEDGTYIYESQRDADRDGTGARAFAVICSPSQQSDGEAPTINLSAHFPPMSHGMAHDMR